MSLSLTLAMSPKALPYKGQALGEGQAMLDPHLEAGLTQHGVESSNAEPSSQSLIMLDTWRLKERLTLFSVFTLELAFTTCHTYIISSKDPSLFYHTV